MIFSLSLINRTCFPFKLV